MLVDEDGLFALVEHLAKEQALAEGGEDEEKPEEGKGAARRTQRDEEMPDAAAGRRRKTERRSREEAVEPKPEPNKPDSSLTRRRRSRAVPGPRARKRQQHAEDSTPLWVNKYKPSAPAQLIGNGKTSRTCVVSADVGGDSPHRRAPERGAEGWDKPMKAVLISGPPGIGKSSAATIIARQLGFEVTEVNASDTREELGGRAGRGRGEGVQRDSGDGDEPRGELLRGQAEEDGLVMDEVDGMSGGDRGGVQELIACIKMSKIPIVCICNDKYNQKLKSLQNYTQDMPFSGRPSRRS